MKGYMPWPGKIMVPPAAAKRKKNHHYVFFFGSEDHAWIPDQNIELHSESLVKKYGSKKPGPYRKAVNDIIEHSKQVKPNVNNFHSSCSISKNHKILPMKKTFSAKKPSLVKKSARKLTLSCDKSKKLNEHHMEFCSPKFLDGSSAQRISNIVEPSGSCSSLTVTDTLQSECCSRPSTPNISPQVTDMPQSASSNLTDSGVYNLTSQSEDLSKKKIGFLGLGNISQGILKNLQRTGHDIIMCKYSSNESEFAEELNIQIADTPKDVFARADIIISCVDDADMAKSHVFGPIELREESVRNGGKKGYVEMTSMDPKSNIAIGHDITRWGRYLEAPLSGSTTDANNGTLLVAAAGDRSLYEECKSVFDAISKNHFFVSSEVGTASKLCLVNNMFLGTVFATVKEVLTLVQKSKLKEESLEYILKYGALNSQNISQKGIVTIKTEYDSNASLKKTQQELIFGLQLGERLVQSTPIFAAAREVYKRYV